MKSTQRQQRNVSGPSRAPQALAHIARFRWLAFRFLLQLHFLALFFLAQPALAQMQLASTVGVLPALPVTHSLLLGDRQPALAGQWLSPVSAEQQGWIDNISARANQSPSGVVPATFAAAASDSSVAQAAALRFAMTGSTADLNKAVGALERLAVPDPNNGNGFIIRPEVLASYLSAYDFIRGASDAQLPAATRATIETRLMSEAQSLDYGNNTYSNARAKIGATLGLAGEMLGDQALLDRALADLQGHFNYSTTDDGYFTDSPGHYLNYTLRHVGLFARAYEQGSGVNLWPALAPYAQMSLGLRLPDGSVPNVSNGLHLPAATQMLSAVADPATKSTLRWALEQTEPSPYGWTGTNVTNNDGTYSSMFALTDFSVPSAAPATSPTFFAPGQSKLAVFRQSWEPSSDYLALSPGIDSPAAEFTIGNPPQTFRIPAFHSHNDTGELLLAAKGKYILVAPGYARTDLPHSPPGFDPQNPAWHNVVLVDGDTGANNEGRTMRPEDFAIANRLDGAELGGFSGVSDFSTLRTTYGGAQVERNMAFPGEDYFVVLDRLHSNSAHAYTFNLVGRGTQTVFDQQPQAATVAWQFEGAEVVERLFATAPVALSTSGLYMHDDFDQFEPTRRMQAQVSAADAMFLSVLDTADGADPADLNVTLLESNSERLGVSIESAGASWLDTILAQLSGSGSAGALASDAFYAYAREESGALSRVMMSEGTWLDYAGTPQLAASSPLTVSLAWDDQHARGTLSSDGISGPQWLRLFGHAPIATAFLDGAPLGFDNQGAWSDVFFSGGGHLAIEFAAVPEPSGTVLLGLGLLGLARSRRIRRGRPT